MKFNHFDNKGNAVMVDVSKKEETERVALAKGKISVGEEVLQLIKNGDVKKGDVLGVARIAGIMATKKTSDIIPMCHPLMITNSSIDFEINDEDKSIIALCTVKILSRTGVEMEALSGVSAALLTIYDMCKAVNKRMVISDMHLVRKTGGKNGEFNFNEQK